MKNQLSTITNQIFNTPLWVQEIIYLDLQKNLKDLLPGFNATTSSELIITTYIPEITFKGKQELETHGHTLDLNIYKLLESVKEEKRIADITLNNFWTLEQTASYVAYCIKNEFVKEPVDKVLTAGIFYLSGDIRLGEYVKRVDKISIEDLDDVLRRQKIYNTDNPDTQKRIGEVLIDMGYVANKDIDKILKIKAESKRRFIVTNEEKALTQNDYIEHDEIQQKIQKLTAENTLLKDKLRAVFNIQNKCKSN